MSQGFPAAVARKTEATRGTGRETGVEPTIGIEPMTPSLPRKCSATEPRGRKRNPGPDRAEEWTPPAPGEPVRPVERETGFEPATLSLEG